MIPVEICINCSTVSAVSQSVLAARQGGAARVELCSQMAQHGLTPDANHILAARKVFGEHKGVLAMIRPRPGDFAYSQAELEQMRQQIEAAAQAGADGVVLGVVENGRISLPSLLSLLKIAKQHHLSVTFHRAFDALKKPAQVIPLLIEQGVDRVLTSGTGWGSGKTAVSGIPHLIHYIQQAGTQLEIVMGGGITPVNAQQLLSQLPPAGKISIHAYSGVLQNGLVDAELVRQLCEI